MQNYKKLVVWQKAHNLVLGVYADSAIYLRRRDAWPIADQIRPAAISIAANIEYDLLLARDLDFLPLASYTRLAGYTAEVRRILTGLVQAIEA